MSNKQISFDVKEDVSEYLLLNILKFKPQNLLDFVQPEKLENEIEQKFGSFEGMTEEQINSTVQFVLKNSVNTSHPLFLNQLYGGVHPIGLAASFIIEKMNTNNHTYEVAPIFVIAEKMVLRELRKLFFGCSEGDGIFAPGGSIANMYGIVLARHQKFPNAKYEGLSQIPQLVVYTSEDAHYSVSKASNWLGFGLNNVIKVKTNKDGSMIPSELRKEIEKSIQEGKSPLVVMTTAGTTVLGSFDPFEQISEICKSYGIWMHCDAAWGGSFIFSDKLRTKWLQGIEKCDSICWNAHKMLGAPLQCSAFIVRYAGVLSECNSLSVSYLFQPDKYYPPSYDSSGDKSVQCGRKADAFKLWLMWVSLGTKEFGRAIEETEECARYVTELVKKRDGFVLYLDHHQSTNVFFWFIPKRMREMERNQKWWEEIGKVTCKIKELMVLQGSMMVGYSPIPHKGVPNAIRLVITAYPQRTKEDMDFVIDSIEELGNSL